MATDFFQKQEAAKVNTFWLVSCLLLGLLVLNLAIYLAVVVIFTLFRSGPVRVDRSGELASSLFQPDILVITVPFITGLIVLCSLYRMFTLRGGGQKVAEGLGGVLIHPDTTDVEEKRLINVVEEMAIASGMPVPPVYYLPRERGINAFAAGFTTRDAVIGVNRGTLKHLTRDELQGVIAHEFSHILNGDMRLNLRLMGVLFGLIALGIFGRLLVRVSQRRSWDDRDNGTPHLLVLGLVVSVLGYLGHLVSSVIKAAISRQREYLADASAVQFTRSPDGIAGALKKIGGYVESSKVDNPSVEEASHMFFALPVVPRFQRLFSTHPPLVSRIQAIDPLFDGEFPALDGKSYSSQKSLASSFSGAESAKLEPEPLLERVGTLGWEQTLLSKQIIESIPIGLKRAAGEPHGACSLVFALLLDEQDPEVMRKQLSVIDQRLPFGMSREISGLIGDARQLKPALKLPVVELALSSLRQLSQSQYLGFSQIVRELASLDKNISVFDYVLQVILLRSLEPVYKGRISKRVRYRSLFSLKRQAATVLSVLSAAATKQINNSSASEQSTQALKRKTFLAAISQLEELGKSDFQDLGLCLKSLDQALAALALASPSIKKRVVAAAIASINLDQQVTVIELELLRAVCESLDCPIPPFIRNFRDS